MRLSIEWNRPLHLKDATQDRMLYTFDTTKVESKPGLYVFGRLHGESFEALYVGKAENLQIRTCQHLNNLKLMMHIKGAKTGQRVLIVGIFKAAPGQQTKNCLPILERSYIRHFMSQGHNLSNIHGTQMLRHEIISSGSKHMPKTAFVDRAKS